jgi:DNA-binding transcriptional MerR regulator
MIYENENLVIPLRTKTNRRRYSQNDVKRLQFIRYLTSVKGINLAGVESILAMLKFGEKNGIDLQSVCFPDFTATDLV